MRTVCLRNGQNIFMIGMFIVDYFQYCFLGKGGRGVKKKVFCLLRTAFENVSLFAPEL